MSVSLCSCAHVVCGFGQCEFLPDVTEGQVELWVGREEGERVLQDPGESS